MRTRSSRRTCWFDSAASSNGSADTAARGPRRRRAENNNNSDAGITEDFTTPHSEPGYPMTPSAPLLSPDAVLRNLAFVAVLGTLALLFINVALYVGVVVVGVLIPAWRTFKALEQPATNVEIIEIDGDLVEIPSSSPHAVSYDEVNDNLRNWHKYWILTAMLLAIHAFVGRPFVSPIIPGALYRVGFLCLFSWMNSNRGANAARLYDAFVKPTLLRSEHAIDVCVESALGHIDGFTRHIILAVNQVVEPYARQLEHAAETTRRQMENQARHRNIPANYFD